MTMGAPRLSLRALALIWGVLQFALPQAILFGDSLVARASALQPGPHVESTGGDTCQPVHADNCAFCRLLSDDCMPARRPSVDILSSTGGVLSTGRPTSLPARTGSRLPDSRAPPIA
jgi:hypothetical protein